MPLTLTNSEREPHIAAITHSRDAGFTFLHVAEYDGGPLAAIHAERHSLGAVDIYTFRDMHEAIAARYPTEDYPHGQPVWQRSGSVADVVHDLLALPPHGSPRAPTRAVHPASALWLPSRL